jgi:hypothetical protein
LEIIFTYYIPSTSGGRQMKTNDPLGCGQS